MSTLSSMQNVVKLQDKTEDSEFGQQTCHSLSGTFGLMETLCMYSFKLKTT